MQFCAMVVSKDSSEVQLFNVAQLVIRYTRKFASTDPREAVQYFYLLKLVSLLSCNLVIVTSSLVSEV